MRLWNTGCATTTIFVVGLLPAAYAGEVVSWRNDGKGEFKAVTAPIHWSDKDGVAWKSRLPASSISSPVVTAQFAFVMAEPNRLLCVRLSDGKVLWDRAHEYEAVFSPQKVAEINNYWFSYADRG